jgi:hypothetical protein
MEQILNTPITADAGVGELARFLSEGQQRMTISDSTVK